MTSSCNNNDTNDFILRVDSCITPREIIHNASILCRGGIIQAVGAYSVLRMLADAPCIHMPNCRAIPGLIDTHLHGTGGFATMDVRDTCDLTPISRMLARHGVTGYVLTLLSAPARRMQDVAAAVVAAFGNEHPGAVPLGIHLEGPYLSPAKRGAQSQEDLRPVDLAEAHDLLQAANGQVRLVTFAPELPGSDTLISLLIEHGVTPSMGHSMADEKDVMRAIDAGTARCTHLFNGMPPLDQRKVGLASVGLTNDRLTIELIVDGIHVHPMMIDLACRAKPRTHVIGISDATQGAGMPEGVYHLGGKDVRIKDGECRRVSDNTLAGSSLILDVALRNLKRYSALSECEVLACFTQNAAASIGYTDRGIIQPGKRADIAVIDGDWNVQMTIVNGQIAFDARSEA